MLCEERKYQFRERLSIVHPSDIYDGTVVKKDDEFVLPDGLAVVLPVDAGEVAVTGARDFCEFLFDSMHISARVARRGEGAVTVVVDPDYGAYKAFKAEITPDGITITAHDERGAAQGLYFLEDEMTARHAPFVKYGITERAPLFSPRMTHSGYMIDEFPESHLAQIAHAGMDAILVMVAGTFESFHGHTPQSLWGYTDFSDLVRRAARWGLDVYAYTYMESLYHPADPKADEYYQSTYGELFRNCPGFKGLICVGECVFFPSGDPHVAQKGTLAPREKSIDWPCCDYADWIGMIKRIISQYNPDADIVLWSYNWGGAPADARQELIRRLPEGVSMLVTFDTYEQIPMGDGYWQDVTDYSLSFEGPGYYFTSEAEVAKECGVRLYAMTNTGGNTWDFGGIPYEPMPGQWLRRAGKILEAKEKYGLCGLMECHQYGFTPSVISEMFKYIYDTGSCEVEKELIRIVQRHFGFGQEQKILDALEKWSEAIRLLPPSKEEQYGAFRVGPCFPLNLAEPHLYPRDRGAYHGYFMMSQYPIRNEGPDLSSVRLPIQKKRLEEMLVLLKEGIEMLAAIPDPNIELEYLINLGRYMACTVTTGINAKRWYRMTFRLQAAEERDEVERLLDEAQEILDDERENVRCAIPIVKNDSRLGFDPLEYVCDPERLLWKLDQLDHVQKVELPQYRACNRAEDSLYRQKKTMCTSE